MKQKKAVALVADDDGNIHVAWTPVGQTTEDTQTEYRKLDEETKAIILDTLNQSTGKAA